METALLWLALGASALALLFALLQPAIAVRYPTGAAGASPLMDEERSAWRPLLIAGSLAAMALFALMLPTRPPWSAGQGMGAGFLMGSVCALCAGVLVRQLQRRVLTTPKEPAPAMLQLAGLATGAGLLAIGVIAALLAMAVAPRGSIFDCLNGAALGALAMAGLLRLGLGLRAAGGGRLADGAALEGWGLFTATLTSALSLGMAHFHRSEAPAQLTPVGLAGLVVIAAIAGAYFGPWAGPARVFGAAGLLATAAVGVLAALAGTRGLAVEGLLPVMLLGLGTALIVGLLAWSALSHGQEGEAPPPYGLESAVLVALMLLGMCVVSFQWLRGYGVGLALLAGWPAGSAALAALCWRDLERASAARWRRPEEPACARIEAAAGSVMRYLGVGLLPLLFRLFLEHGRYRPSVADLSLTVHFTLVGLVAGAVAPLLLAVMLRRAAQRSSPAGGPGLQTAVAAGFWAVALPAGIGVALGRSGQAGLLAGLLIAGLYALFFAAAGTPRRVVGFLASGTLLASLGMALVAIQGSHLLTQAAVLDRRVKVASLATVAVIGLVWMVLSARAARVSVFAGAAPANCIGGKE